MKNLAGLFATAVLILTVSCGFAQQTQQQNTNDHFIDVTQTRTQFDESVMIYPQPLDLPDIELPLSSEGPHITFQTPPDMQTPEQLTAELAKFREQFAPFMRDLSPAFNETRRKIHLDDFLWRPQTPEDLADFPGHTLAGKGQWTKVKLPHYAPPTGKAVTYYHKTFSLPAELLEQPAVFVGFLGVDYRASVFVNGSYIGSHEGYFAPFEFECKRLLHPGENTLVVQVENDYANHPTIDPQTGNKLFSYNAFYASRTEPNFEHQLPPWGWLLDATGMGISNDVYIEGRSDVYISDIFVRPLDAQKAEAHIEITALPRESKEIRLQFSVNGHNFQQTVISDEPFAPQYAGSAVPTVDGGENRFIIPFTIPDARLWSPDTPWLYSFRVQVQDPNGRPIDTRQNTFGMRTFTMQDQTYPKGDFYLNGNRLKLRGTNTQGSFRGTLARKDYARLRDDMLLAKICGINFIRLTGRVMPSAFYDMCDALGLMTQTDFPACSCLQRSLLIEALKQADEMERLVRGHPCNFMVSLINEPLPNIHLKTLRRRHLIRPELQDFYALASAVIRQANPDRIVKPAEGNYDPPAPGLPDHHCYPAWYNGHHVDLGKLHAGCWGHVKQGWNYTCGEFGVEGLDPEPLMRKYYPDEWLRPDSAGRWNPDAILNAQTYKMHFIWFEDQDTIEDWVRHSQAHQAWGIDIITRAFRRDPRMNGFCIHLFIDSFPSAWMKAIIDYDRTPKPVYFTYRKALSPVLVDLRTDRFGYGSGRKTETEIWICNDRPERLENCTLRYVVNHENRTIYSGQSSVDVEPSEPRFHGYLRFPAPPAASRTDLVIHAALFDSDGVLINDHSLHCDVFPAPAAQQNRRVNILASPDSEPAALVKALDLDHVLAAEPAPDDVLLTDLAGFNQHRQSVLHAVEAGAVLVLHKLPIGTHTFDFGTVTVNPSPMNPLHFASRKTGHAIVEGFRPDDFKFWYDRDKGYVTPFLDSTLSADGFSPILLSGKKSDYIFEILPAMAACERKLGKGLIRINQLDLANRVLDVPPAEIYALRLLEVNEK